MTPENVRQYLLSRPEAKEEFPFPRHPDVAVFKVKGKMFATYAVEDGVYRINLKCEPELAIQLRDVFEAVSAGYHMNKKHWNTVLLTGEVPDAELEQMIDHSYGRVVKGMTRAQRASLELHYSSEQLYGE